MAAPVIRSETEVPKHSGAKKPASARGPKLSITLQAAILSGLFLILGACITAIIGPIIVAKLPPGALPSVGTTDQRAELTKFLSGTITATQLGDPVTVWPRTNYSTQRFVGGWMLWIDNPEGPDSVFVLPDGGLGVKAHGGNYGRYDNA